MVEAQGEERKRGPGRPKKIFPDPEVVEDITEAPPSQPPTDKVDKVLCFMPNVNQFSMYRDEGNVHIRAIREDGAIIDEIISMSSETHVSVRLT